MIANCNCKGKNNTECKDMSYYYRTAEPKVLEKGSKSGTADETSDNERFLRDQRPIALQSIPQIYTNFEWGKE